MSRSDPSTDSAQKLREEIAIHCGMDPPTYDTIKKMKYRMSDDLLL